MAVREMDMVIFVIRVHIIVFFLLFSRLNQTCFGLCFFRSCLHVHVLVFDAICLYCAFVLAFELACVVYSPFNESHRMRQHSCTHRDTHTYTHTRNHMRCSECECAHNCKCECVSKATYAFVHFPAIAVAAAATYARNEYTSPCTM